MDTLFNIFGAFLVIALGCGMVFLMVGLIVAMLHAPTPNTSKTWIWISDQFTLFKLKHTEYRLVEVGHKVGELVQTRVETRTLFPAGLGRWYRDPGTSNVDDAHHNECRYQSLVDGLKVELEDLQLRHDRSYKHVISEHRVTQYTPVVKRTTGSNGRARAADAGWLHPNYGGLPPMSINYGGLFVPADEEDDRELSDVLLGLGNEPKNLIKDGKEGGVLDPSGVIKDFEKGVK